MFYSYGETTYKIRNYFLPKPRFNSTSRNWQNAKTTNDKFTNIQIWFFFFKKTFKVHDYWTYDFKMYFKIYGYQKYLK